MSFVSTVQITTTSFVLTSFFLHPKIFVTFFAFHFDVNAEIEQDIKSKETDVRMNLIYVEYVTH